MLQLSGFSLDLSVSSVMLLPIQNNQPLKMCSAELS